MKLFAEDIMIMIMNMHKFKHGQTPYDHTFIVIINYMQLLVREEMK